jgi:glycosyltransferase involved in cell wall biosynthesis
MYGFEEGDLKTILSWMSLVILSRPNVADRWLATVRAHAPDALVVYDTVDLHWLREARRQALLTGSSEELAFTREIHKTRELERGLIEDADVTIVVSEVERLRVESHVPGASVRVIPNLNPVRHDVPGLERRAGLVFVGGFEHTPNVDATLVLVRDVMPRVWEALPDVKVTIVGPDPPAEVTELASPRVEVAGWVPRLDPILDRARAMVAPLTYGAGLKGKVTQALAAGLPVVTTPIGAEGLDAQDGSELLIGADADELASRTVRILSDDQLWEQLSQAGRVLAEETCSQRIVSERLGELLELAQARDPITAR